MSQQDTNSSLHLDEPIQTPSKKSNTMQSVFKLDGPHLQIHCHNGDETMPEHHKSQENKMERLI
jgi:hypothetical protein